MRMEKISSRTSVQEGASRAKIPVVVGTRISTMLDKDMYDFCKPTLQCESQSTHSIFILRISVCAMLEKQMSNVCISLW